MTSVQKNPSKLALTYRRRAALTTLVLVFMFAVAANAQQDTPIIHTIRLAGAKKQLVEVETTVPTSSQDSVEIVMPVWAPGFYRIENFAENLSDVSATSLDGKTLEIKQTHPNRWSVVSAGTDAIKVTYHMKCERAFVVSNWIGEDFAVFNGPATFFYVASDQKRPHRVRLELPEQWQAFSGLESVPNQANEFEAPNYDTLVDSPIMAGKNLSVNEFDVAGAKHVLVSAGEHPGWDGAKAAANLAQMVQGQHDFWGQLPFKRYVFLNMFDKGGGGLEHLNSTLITTRLNPNAKDTEPWSAFGWLAFVSHEYFHTFNVKRLRPIELGPFDYEHPPRTASLWISEGLTSYYGDLIVVRSGLAKPTDFLGSMSSYIRQLQESPGRLKQSLEQASLDVWSSGMSGVTSDKDNKISYYIKGPVVGFLLDAKIRQVTNGAKSLDDVMRLAYSRYSGEHGFTPTDFVAVAEEVAGVDLHTWFKHHLASTEELDYTAALAWFGLQFTAGTDPKTQWSLSVRADATDAQQAEFRRLTSGPSAAESTPK